MSKLNNLDNSQGCKLTSYLIQRTLDIAKLDIVDSIVTTEKTALIYCSSMPNKFKSYESFSFQNQIRNMRENFLIKIVTVVCKIKDDNLIYTIRMAQCANR